MACPSSDDMCMASRESIQPVGNVRSDIIQARQESASRADMVLVSGGLGPTFRPRDQVVVPHGGHPGGRNEDPEGPSRAGDVPRHHFNAPAGISTTYVSTSVALPLPQLEPKTTRVKSRLTLACGSLQ